jgi:hypothetical protein
VITTTDAITASAIAIAGASTAVVAALRAGREHHAEPAPRSRPAFIEPVAYVPCHTTVCGHMSTPHDRTPAGLTCRGCKTTKEEL